MRNILQLKYHFLQLDFQSSMNDSQLNEILEKLLGKNAIHNRFQVDKDFAKLIKTIQYLHTQLDIVKNKSEESVKAHIEKVILNSKELLCE